MPATGHTVSGVGQGRRNKARKARSAADAEYRRQLGVAAGERLPSIIGEAHSAGAAKGGKPGARPHGRSPFGGKGKRRAPAPDIKVTAGQVRTVVCPRCRASVEAPCRNEYGRTVSGGHPDRRRLAQRQISQQQRRGNRSGGAGQAQRIRRDDTPISGEELAERRRVAQQARVGRQPQVEDGRAVYSVDAATSRTTRHRLRVDNGI